MDLSLVPHLICSGVPRPARQRAFFVIGVEFDMGRERQAEQIAQNVGNTRTWLAASAFPPTGGSSAVADLARG
jgi:hypothetical protein